MEMYTIYTMQEGFKYIKSACMEQKRRTVRPNLIYIFRSSYTYISRLLANVDMATIYTLQEGFRLIQYLYTWNQRDERPISRYTFTSSYTYISRLLANMGKAKIYTLREGFKYIQSACRESKRGE